MLDTTTSSTTYQGGDGQAVFPIPFPFLENSHIHGRVRDALGATTDLVPGVDFTVNSMSEGNGEFILLGAALAAGSFLTVSRRVPLTQEIMFHNQGPNSPRATEEAADKLTMIAQQLQDDLDGCFTVPPGADADALREVLLGSGEAVARLDARIASLSSDLAGKADRGHGHNLAAVAGLADGLAAKADAQSVAAALAAKAGAIHDHPQSDIAGLAAALAAKADGAQLQGKADAAHSHGLADVSGLAAALTAKADADDPRFQQTGAHAAAHAQGGSDAITPAAIGAMTPPPADGKPYLAAAGGWIEYVAPSGGDDGGGEGTADHSQLINRDAADQHPQSAIQHLTGDLAAINAALAAKADASALPAPATAVANGLLTAADKAKLDSLDPAAQLPAGGGAGDFLVRTAGSPAWHTPLQAAENLPSMSYARKGVARLSTGKGLELDADGRLGLAADNLVSAAAVGGISAGLTQLTQSLGAMAYSGDAPADGKAYARKDGAWQEAASGGGGGGGGAIVGEIRLLPFRSGALPPGWYFCNGDGYALSSAQGTALAALPATLKSDWGIAVSGSTISLPNLFSGTAGYFLRPVNNATRQPGSVQSDAIRNITGSFTLAVNAGLVMKTNANDKSTLSGAFKAGSFVHERQVAMQDKGSEISADFLFDASGSVATAEENRPLNIGMTPAIYLGV